MLIREDGPGLIRMLKDPRISLKTKGLLAYLSKCPESIDITIEYIAQDTKDGRIAISNAINEAEEAGYIERERMRDKQGRWGQYRWKVKL